MFFVDSLLEEIKDTSSLPKKCELDDTHYLFIYENKIETYPITKSEFLNFSEQTTKKDESLIFCGKEVKIEGELEKRKCAPNNFMCRDCMEKNKKRFNLPKECLIGINGRIAKINKNKYHCFGIFENKNNFEQCLTKFTCKSCEILNLLKNYYN